MQLAGCWLRSQAWILAEWIKDGLQHTKTVRALSIKEGRTGHAVRKGLLFQLGLERPVVKATHASHMPQGGDGGRAPARMTMTTERTTTRLPLSTLLTPIICRISDINACPRRFLGQDSPSVGSVSRRPVIIDQKADFAVVLSASARCGGYP